MQNGFVLIVVLLFMQIITMIAILSLQFATLAMKHGAGYRELHSLQNTAEKYLSEIEKINGTERCIMSIVPNRDLLAILNSSAACSGEFKNMKYHYIIETLMDDPCALITAQPKAIAQYYRTSLLVSSELSHVILQSTYIHPIQSEKICEDHCHFVVSGRQSWRDLSNYLL